MRNFNEKVWEVARHIPYGKVTSYGRIAKLLGAPHAAREVGWAMAALGNVPNSGVPWQRVVNGEGRISISNHDHSADEQRRLLMAEGVQFDGENDLKILGFNAILWSPSPLEIQHLLAEDSEQT